MDDDPMKISKAIRISRKCLGIVCQNITLALGVKFACLICNEPDGYYQLELDKYLSEKDIALNSYMRVQSIEALKRCVMNNLGIAVVPSYSVEEELKTFIIFWTGLWTVKGARSRGNGKSGF